MNNPSALTRSNVRSPKTIGDVSEAMVLARLIELGFGVLIPFGDNQRYDFVVDDGEVLTRAQVKTGRLRNGSIVFSTCSTDRDTQLRRTYEGQADIFLVYCFDTGVVYRVPVTDCGTVSKASLRVEPRPSRGPAGRRTRLWASDYVLDETTKQLRLGGFKACAVNHPGKPPRVVEKSVEDGIRRSYCNECKLIWDRRSRSRRAAAGRVF